MLGTFRIGLKLWSTNDYYIRPARELFDKGYFDYIELYTLPGSLDGYADKWKGMNGIPYHIHAPHFGEGMNLAKREKEKSNLAMAAEALRYADILKADKVIFHPGVDGDTDETIRQLKLINDGRILVENKPYVSIDNQHVCNGYSTDEITRICSETGAGFCLDFGHAICAANSLKLDPIDNIRNFIALKPGLYHLTDGKYDSPYDSHLHYGQGSYPVARLLKMVPAGASITNEAVKDSKENLDDVVRDMEYLRDCLQ